MVPGSTLMYGSSFCMRTCNPRRSRSIPIEALVIKAVLPALTAFPEFNASLDGDDLIVHGSHDVGIAVDTPDGLLVAVIPDAGHCFWHWRQ